MRKTNRKLWIVSAVLILVLTAVLSACGGADRNDPAGSAGTNAGNSENTGDTGNSGSSADSGNGSANAGGGDGGGSEPPVKVTIMSHFFNATPPQDGNPVELAIEKATNTELDIQWVSANNYTDKLNVTLASGDMPDLLFINDPFSPTYRSAAEQGAFWDLAPFIDDYPNLKATISDIAWELTKINGANYGIPRPRPSEGETFFIIRKDWLDNLGLEVPETTDELYAVMKAFTENDPDGNGQNDTTGFAGYVNPEDMGNMGVIESSFTGANGLWKDVNGELVFTAFLPETREALEYLANAYKEKLIPPDFASMKVSQAKDLFKANKAGIISEKSGALQEYYDVLKEIVPDFEMTDMLPLVSMNGFNPKGPGFAGVNVIPKSVPEDKVRKILAMYDKWTTEEVFILHQRGIEGIHHKVENGEVVIDTERMQADAISDYNQIVYVSDPYASTVKPTFPEEAQRLYAEIQDERAKTSVADVSIGLYSETAQTYLSELKKKLQDMKTKVILGTASLDDWDQFVEQLKNDANMKKMIEEMNEAYRSR